MKNRKLVVLLVFFCVSVPFLWSQNKSANRKTAERCLKLAENCVISSNWSTALSQAELGLSYDDTISDLYYTKANAQMHLTDGNYLKADILKTIEKAFEINNWVNYNKTSARILYADLLSETKLYDKSLNILDSDPLIYSADAEFIRIKNLYRKGTSDSIKEARNKLGSAKKIYSNDIRFPKLFFLFETKFMNVAERNGIKYEIPQNVKHMAETYIVKFPDYNTKDVEMEMMSSMFSDGERQKRLIKAIGEKNQNSVLFAISGLKAGVITEEKAYNIFFKAYENTGYFDLVLLEDFASLITDSNLKKNLYDTLNSFDGTLVLDEDLDLNNELVVKYYRGRPQTIYYDENNDGIYEIISECDFGVPMNIKFGNTLTELVYDIYPCVKKIDVVAEKSKYTFLDDDFPYTPFEMLVNPPFRKLNVDFYIPYINSEIQEPDYNAIVKRANSVEIPIDERPGAIAKYTIYKGVPVLIYFYEGDKEYAYANLEAGYPFIRYVDYNNNNQYDTSEIYDYDTDKKYNSSEAKELITKTFGNISLTENLYLKKVEIDNDNDTIIDFKEEYTGNNGKTVSWDLDGNGLWDLVYIRYPDDENGNLVEETIIYNNNNTSTILVRNENSIPVNLTYNKKSYPVVKGRNKNYYWINNLGTENQESTIYATVGEKMDIAAVRVVQVENKRFSVIRIEDMIFCKELSDSNNYDFKEFVNE